MRPQSEIRVALMAALVDGRGSVRQLAQRTGWSVSRTRTALDNMERADDVEVVEMVPQRGSRRRVPVYARKQPADVLFEDGDDQASSGADLGRTLFQAWFQPLAAQHTGAQEVAM